MKKLQKLPRVYLALRNNKPVAKIPELGETTDPHADMLRHDQAFCHPTEPSLVVFPIFQYPREGRSSANITLARWRSFSMTLEPLPEPYDARLDQWVTYRHPVGGSLGVLQPQTLAEYLKDHPKVKVVGWR